MISLQNYLKKMNDIDAYMYIYMECLLKMSELDMKKEGSAKELWAGIVAFVTVGIQVHWEGTLCNSLSASPLSESLLTRIILIMCIDIYIYICLYVCILYMYIYIEERIMICKVE